MPTCSDPAWSRPRGLVRAASSADSMLHVTILLRIHCSRRYVKHVLALTALQHLTPSDLMTSSCHNQYTPPTVVTVRCFTVTCSSLSTAFTQSCVYLLSLRFIFHVHIPFARIMVDESFKSWRHDIEHEGVRDTIPSHLNITDMFRGLLVYRRLSDLLCFQATDLVFFGFQQGFVHLSPSFGLGLRS